MPEFCPSMLLMIIGFVFVLRNKRTFWQSTSQTLLHMALIVTLTTCKRCVLTNNKTYVFYVYLALHLAIDNIKYFHNLMFVISYSLSSSEKFENDTNPVENQQILNRPEYYWSNARTICNSSSPQPTQVEYSTTLVFAID